MDIESVLQIVRQYKSDVRKIVKDWDYDVDEIIEKSLDKDTSLRAIAGTMFEMQIADSKIYDISIIRMEAKALLEKVPASQGLLKRELKLLLNIANDSNGIAKRRYDHLATILSGIRSMNSNYRTYNKGTSYTYK